MSRSARDRLALALTAAFGTRLLFGAPQDAVAGVDPTIVVNGVVATDFLTSEWAALGLQRAGVDGGAQHGDAGG